jgi:hypothetical protein
MLIRQFSMIQSRQQVVSTSRTNLDQVCQRAADMIKGKQPEEDIDIHTIFSIKIILLLKKSKNYYLWNYGWFRSDDMTPRIM